MRRSSRNSLIDAFILSLRTAQDRAGAACGSTGEGPPPRSNRGETDMGDPSPKTLTTTAADLVAAIDATLTRCFGGLDEADEARRLGLPTAAVRALREKLEDLRKLAAKAAGG